MLLCFGPAAGTETPSVAGLQARKSKFLPWRHKIVAARPREREKLVRQHRAYCVRPDILVAGVAAAIAKETGQWGCATRLKWFVEYVECFVHALDYAIRTAACSAAIACRAG